MGGAARLGRRSGRGAERERSGGHERGGAATVPEAVPTRPAMSRRPDETRTPRSRRVHSRGETKPHLSRPRLRDLDSLPEDREGRDGSGARVRRRGWSSDSEEGKGEEGLCVGSGSKD